MTFIGQVLNCSSEERELVGKDGVKNKRKISHVLLASGKIGAPDYEIINLRSYDAAWDLPEIGKTWTTPPVKKYENYTGVAEVMV
jgi:hypothetical protein